VTALVIAESLEGIEPNYLRRVADLGEGTVDDAAAALRAQLRGDCHSHSDWSDGGSPIEEMAFTAMELGHDYLVLTDHSPRLKVARGLSAERLARQLGVVDAEGRAAAHTGAECIPACGHRVGDGYTVQGNLLERDTCWPAMADAYETALTRGEPFVERLLLALEAAEREGGDVRGRQSAAIMVVDGKVRPTRWRGRLWGGRLMDLRIEDHADPVPELRRIVTMQLAYDLSDSDGDAARAGQSAADRYAQVRKLAPDAYELVFWTGLELATAGDIEAGRRELQIAFAADSRWRTTLQHLADAGREGVTPELAASLLG